MAAKKASAKRPAKKAAKKSGAKRPAAKKPAKKAARKSASASSKRPVKKAAAKRASVKKAPAKKTAAKKVSAATVAAKIEIPPVPTRGTTQVSSAPQVAPAKPQAPTAPVKKSSPTVLFMVIAGVALLAIFALANRSSDDSAAPKPESSPTAEASATPSASESATLAAHEAPLGFVALANGDGVTLRWKAPAASEGITGYTISISYNAKDFKEVATVSANEFKLDVKKVGEEGGTQFLIQTVYSDGVKVDGKKFSLKGKYE